MNTNPSAATPDEHHMQLPLKLRQVGLTIRVSEISDHFSFCQCDFPRVEDAEPEVVPLAIEEMAAGKELVDSGEDECIGEDVDRPSIIAGAPCQDLCATEQAVEDDGDAVRSGRCGGESGRAVLRGQDAVGRGKAYAGPRRGAEEEEREIGLPQQKPSSFGGEDIDTRKLREIYVDNRVA